MTCNDVRQHWMLYLDSEGDPAFHFRISEHLAMCPNCAGWFATQQQFEQAFNGRMAGGEPTPQLWARVEHRIRRGVRRRWLIGGGALAAAAAALVFALVLTRPSPSSGLAHLSADWHQQWLQGNMEPDLRSSSDEQVERYLRGKISFPVHCPPRKDVRFALEGAGVRDAEKKRVAYFVGQIDDGRVSIFVLARDSLDAFPNERAHLAQGRGRHRCREGIYQMVSGVTADNVVVVVGSASADRLEELLNAYGSYHEEI